MYEAPRKDMSIEELLCSDYLVEDFGDHLEIHRVLSQDEIGEFPKEQVFVSVEDDHCLSRIAIADTGEEAEVAIRSYWSAINKLNLLVSEIDFSNSTNITATDTLDVMDLAREGSEKFRRTIDKLAKN